MMAIRPKHDVCYVDHWGVGRLGGWPPSVQGAVLMAESEAACAAILSASAPPPDCGGEMPVAPARGPMQSFQPREMVRTDAGNFVSRNAGYRGRRAARVSDAFDLMTLAAWKAHCRVADKAARAGRAAPAFVPPFTHGQVYVARGYAALSERCEAAGVKCSSLEALRAARSGGGDREEAMLADFQLLRAFHARIGTGLAKEVRRHRPSATGGPRHAIRVRDLVDQVCLGGMTLSEVLARHGWRSKNENVRQGLQAALCAALDRMQGYDLAHPQDVG